MYEDHPPHHFAGSSDYRDDFCTICGVHDQKHPVPEGQELFNGPRAKEPIHIRIQVADELTGLAEELGLYDRPRPDANRLQYIREKLARDEYMDADPIRDLLAEVTALNEELSAAHEQHDNDLREEIAHLERLRSPEFQEKGARALFDYHNANDPAVKSGDAHPIDYSTALRALYMDDVRVVIETLFPVRKTQ